MDKFFSYFSIEPELIRDGFDWYPGNIRFCSGKQLHHCVTDLVEKILTDEYRGHQIQSGMTEGIGVEGDRIVEHLIQCRILYQDFDGHWVIDLKHPDEEYDDGPEAYPEECRCCHGWSRAGSLDLVSFMNGEGG